MSKLRDRFRPSTITLWGWDPVELKKYTDIMSPSRGVQCWKPEQFVEMLDRKWFVSNIEWQGGGMEPMLYEITLTAIVEIK